MVDCAGVHLMDFADRAFRLRPAGSEDFRFAWSLYRDLIKQQTEELLEWNEPGQKRVVELALAMNTVYRQQIEQP
jgi:hypothetical protein